MTCFIMYTEEFEAIMKINEKKKLEQKNGRKK